MYVQKKKKNLGGYHISRNKRKRGDPAFPSQLEPKNPRPGPCHYRIRDHGRTSVLEVHSKRPPGLDLPPLPDRARPVPLQIPPPPDFGGIAIPRTPRARISGLLDAELDLPLDPAIQAPTSQVFA